MKCIGFFILLVFNYSLNFGQVNDSLINLGYNDAQRLHFGFTLSLNNSSFKVIEKSTYSDSVLVTSKARPGFSIGILANCRLNNFLSLRFTPNIDFQERDLHYVIPSPLSQVYFYRRRVEVTEMCFPVQLKLHTKKFGNTALYCLGGGYYSVDIGYNRIYTNNITPINPQANQTVQTTKDDFGYNFGGGLDLYLRFYKMSIEVKCQSGIKNVLRQDNTTFTAPIEELKTRCWMVSFVFEG